MKNLIALVLTNVLFNAAHGAEKQISNNQSVPTIEQATHLFEQNQYQESESILNQLLDDKTLIETVNNSALILLSRIALQQNKLDRAEDLFEQSLALSPNTANEYYWFARMSGEQASDASIFTAMGYATDAKEGFLKAIELDPNHLPSHIGLFHFYLSAPGIAGGSVDKAKSLITNIEKLSLNDGAQLRLKWLRDNASADEIASYSLQILNSKSFNAKTQFNAASALVSQSFYAKGFDAFIQLTKLPESEDNQLYRHASLYQMGRTSVVGEIKTAEGILAFENYLKKFSKLPDSIKTQLPSQQWAQYRMNQLLRRNNNIKQADVIIERLKKQALNDPKLAELIHNR